MYCHPFSPLNNIVPIAITRTRGLKLHLGRLQFWNGGRGVAMSSMWVGGFVPSILAMIVTPTLILTLILILGAILEFRCCVSHLAICHFWILLIWPPTATISVTSIQQVCNYSIYNFYRDQLSSWNFDNVTSSAFGPEKYCVGGSRGGYI